GIAENAHQVVFHGEIEAARPRVALAAGAAAQLVVDAAGLVPLRADDVQTARRHDLLVARLPFGPDTLAHPLVGLPAGLLREGGELRLETPSQHDVRAAAR